MGPVLQCRVFQEELQAPLSVGQGLGEGGRPGPRARNVGHRAGLSVSGD